MRQEKLSIDLGLIEITRFERMAIALGISENWEEPVKYIATREQCRRFIRREGMQRVEHWVKVLEEELEDDCEEHQHWHTKRCKCR